ncbi:MAG: family 16 glycosylhydrolase [Alphaproteobacteria bacterium]|nr:family 16 glycosylhydrolase [Alphaproteobacteria bacterium]
MTYPASPLKAWSRFAPALWSICIIVVGFTSAASAPGERTAAGVLAAPFVDHFEVLDKRKWYIANYVNKADWFATAWDRKAIKHFAADSRVELSVMGKPKAGKPFRGAELQRKGYYGYGRYEVVMQPGSGSGTVFSFFTYTGPAFKSPHDEIDFEFLGRNPRKVWLNVFSNGEKLPGRWLDLGFDASAAPQIYAFEWRPDSIIWYASGKEIMRVTSAEKKIPSHASKIMLNVWAGWPRQKAWLGVADEDIVAQASYHCVSYRPFGSQALQCSDTFEAKHGRK